jgi:DNA-binding transcriptional regulator LsrR (DeoR family)
LYFNKHKSQRAIAKEMGIHRATVKRSIKNPEQKYRMNVDRDKPINGDFEKRIKHFLEYNESLESFWQFKPAVKEVLTERKDATRRVC